MSLLSLRPWERALLGGFGSHAFDCPGSHIRPRRSLEDFNCFLSFILSGQVFLLRVCVYHVCTWCLRVPGTDSHTEGYEPSCGCWKPNPRPSAGETAVRTSEASLRSSVLTFDHGKEDLKLFYYYFLMIYLCLFDVH